MFNELKYFIQRGKRGYSDRDLWDFDDYLCDIIPPALRRLKEIHTGCPGDLWDKTAVNNECHKWDDILEEMAQGFEAAQSLSKMEFMKWVKQPSGNLTYELDAIKNQLLTEKYEKGIQLFAKYFLGLWD